MFGLSNRNSSMLLPLIFISVVICAFQATSTAQLVLEWWPKSLFPPDADEFVSLAVALFLQMCIVAAIYLELRCYQSN
uniref:Uncharacterized protein n=1 Tax=Ditylenchus dipsaci TaxID=166011 RepID=A0A915EVV8_9BILA